MYKPRIILDRNRCFYSIYTYPSEDVTSGFPLACHTLCAYNLKRPHLTCLWCRPRRVYYGKMPSKFPVQIIALAVNQKQKHQKIKAAIRKVLITLAGWTLN